MSFRTVYGYSRSENGWRMCNRDECDLIRIPGLSLVDTAPIRKGAPLTILGAFVYWLDRHVEEFFTPLWGWSATNDVPNSNHLAGTAIDIWATKLPWGLPASRYFSAAKIAKIREGLRLFEGTVYWGEDWSRNDPMHFQMAYPEGDPRNDAFAAKLRGGYLGIYGAAPTPAPTSYALTHETLSQAMGGSVTMDRYRALFPAVRDSMIACGATDLNSAAMWLAQIGHESLGLRWMEEIASGAAYEGRQDLGNTQPGDGKRFKGRGPIQVTGRHNYTALSKWAHSQQLVPSPSFFVDYPDELASDRYGFVGVTWYWTQARGSQIRDQARAGNVTAVTNLINGGTNGLTDRQQRYQRAHALGDRIIPATKGALMALSDKEQQELLDKTRVIYDQLGPRLAAWSDASSFGKNAAGQEYTLRDGLIAKLDALAAKIGGLR